MKRNPNYTLCEIEGCYYLLPFGQGIADHERGIQINETGVFLWNTLKDSHTREELLEKFLAHYQAESKDIPILTQDLSHFLFQLTSLGIIVNDLKEISSENSFIMHLQIGPLHLKLTGSSNLFPKEFNNYQTAPYENPDLTIVLSTDILPVIENGTLLIENKELQVWEQSDCYHLLFPESPEIAEAYLLKDGSYAYIHHIENYTASLTEELLHAIRLLYLYTAQLHDCYAIHSASILYQDKAWLFSGHSGMGKSTHTSLWHKLFGTPLLNGDLNLLAFSNDKPIIYGIPWCGTSGISVAEDYPLGGIILLARDEEDSCEELSQDKKALLISQRFISPTWNESMLKKHLKFTQKLSKQIHICQLKCTKNDSAAYTMKDWIDSKSTHL